MFGLIVNMILIVALLIDIFIARNWKKEYKLYREDARKIKQDCKEIKRDNKVLTVHTKYVVACNEKLRDRLTELEEG